MIRLLGWVCVLCAEFSIWSWIDVRTACFVCLCFLGWLLWVDLIKWVSNVRTSVHKMFLRFQWNLVCRLRSMSDAWRYAVWPDPRSRSRSRALQSRKFGHFQRLSPSPFIMGDGKWPRIITLRHNTYSFSWPDFWFLFPFLCHVTLKLAVSRSRPLVPYGATFCTSIREMA